jgi:hypothetical protein
MAECTPDCCQACAVWPSVQLHHQPSVQLHHQTAVRHVLCGLLYSCIMLRTLLLAPSEQFSADGLHTRSSSAENLWVSPVEKDTSSTCTHNGIAVSCMLDAC